MKSRESAAVQAEAAHYAVVHPQQEKSDPLVQRYLGAALFTVLAGPGGKRNHGVDKV